MAWIATLKKLLALEPEMIKLSIKQNPDQLQQIKQGLCDRISFHETVKSDFKVKSKGLDTKEINITLIYMDKVLQELKNDYQQFMNILEDKPLINNVSERVDFLKIKTKYELDDQQEMRIIPKSEMQQKMEIYTSKAKELEKSKQSNESKENIQQNSII